MTKDLFIRLFEQFSRWSFDEYNLNFLDRLPHRLAEAAANANPDLRSCRRFNEIQELFSSVAGRRWRNPELYPYLNFLNIPGHELSPSVEALRVHVGMDPLAGNPIASTRKFWRLRDLDCVVFEIVNGSLVDRSELLVQAPQIDEPAVYQPHANLFDDIQNGLYRGDRSQYVAAEYGDLISESFCAIQRYSAELAAGFRREIGTVGLMQRQAGAARSFSMRNFYIGGVFVSVADRIALSEQLIHEYYHQCIWPWWLIEPPDLPGNDQKIISPVTGRERSVATMMQALLIYVSLADYYRFVLHSYNAETYKDEELSSARNRLAAIENGSEALVQTLTDALAHRPRSREIVDFIASMAA